MGVIFLFLKTVFKGALHLLALFFKIAYNILRVLKIRVLALYLIACGCAQLFFKVFSGQNLVWFWVGGALCLVLTALAWAVHFARKRRAKERKRKEEEEQAQPDAPEQAAPQPTERQIDPPSPLPVQKGVRYYAVEGHKDYYFAEYADRYELYRRGTDGDTYIRTDYKGK